MNNRVLAQFLATLFVGFLFWSMGGVAGWRTLQMAPLPMNWAKQPPAKTRAAEQKARVELSKRVGDDLAEPSRITKNDLKAVKAAWGKDSAKMLSILQESAR